MRLFKKMLAGVLCAALLFATAPAAALAGTGTDPVDRQATEAGPLPAAAQSGTAAESAEYERREAASPEVLDFRGGEAVVSVSVGFVLLVALVVIIVILLGD